MDTITAQKLEYILSGYKLTMEDRDAIIDLMDEYAGVASKNCIKPDVIKSVCEHPILCTIEMDGEKYNYCKKCHYTEKQTVL